MKKALYILNLIFLFSLCGRNVLSAQPLVLGAESHYIYQSATASFFREDSTWYYYSGGSSGNIDSSVSLLSDPGATPYLSSYAYTYDTAGHQLSRLLRNNFGTGWENSMYIDNTYTGDNLTLEVVLGWSSGWYNNIRSSYAFNTHGDRSETISELSAGAGWTNAKHFLFTYDSLYRLIELLIQDPDGGTGWVDLGKYTFQYDTADNCTGRLCQLWYPDSTGTYTWVDVFRMEYSYNSTHDQTGDVYYWIGGISGSAGSMLFTDSNIYDTHHNKLLSFYEQTDVAGTTPLSMRSQWEYNSYNQCTRESTETWDSTTHSWGYTSGYPNTDFIHNYYYGQVAFPDTTHTTPDSTLVVGAFTAASVNLYPSPATDFVRLEVNSSAGQATKIDLIDAMGRSLQHWNEPAAKTLTKTIEVFTLPAGNYFMKISCSGGSVVRPFTVIH